MTPLMQTLLATSVLALFSFVPSSVAYFLNWKLSDIVGNRANTPPLPPWGERAIRANNNMAQQFPIFAALVLLAHVYMPTDAWGLIGAQMFLCFRLVHLLVYVLGISWVRTLAWTLAFAGKIIIVLRLMSLVCTG